MTQDYYDKPGRYSFSRLVDILLQQRDVPLQEHALVPQPPIGLRFRGNSSLGFPARDVHSVEQVFDVHGEAIDIVTLNFLGLTGAQSPLPSYFLDFSARHQFDDHPAVEFLQFFNDRLGWMHYLIGRKYRYDKRYLFDAQDQFSEWMFSFAGLGDPSLRSEQGQDAMAWPTLLGFVSALAARSRSASLISGVLKHTFGLKEVAIESFQHTKLDIPERQKCRLGVVNCQLGVDLSLGSFCSDYNSCFLIRLEGIKEEKFNEFLPGGHEFKRLAQLIAFMNRDQLAYDLELTFDGDSKMAKGLQLGNQSVARLGWVTILGRPKSVDRTASVRFNAKV